MTPQAIGPARAFFVASLASMLILATATVIAEPVGVRFAEGLVHGFLALSSLDGTTIADGDLIQSARGTRVTSRLVFHFKDGSLHDETSVFTQRDQFKILSYHLVQKGPSFPRPLEMSIDPNGVTTVRFTDEHGRAKTEREQIVPPGDLANGMVPILLKNVRRGAVPRQFSMIVATPKPRLVTLKLQAPTQESFSTGGARRKATHYVMKIDIGGLTGLIAPLAGKEPPDQHVWILEDGAPAFLKSEQQLYVDGPLWRIELVSPVWPRSFN